ncbi:MAG TPA: S16 family serine protease, partial [Candidatus Thermoplasmatota archaeon]
MRSSWFVLAIVVLSAPLSVAQSEQTLDRATVRMWIPAVGQREDGTLFGVASSLEVTMHTPGTGQVFLSSRPLTQIDMQGSARLAVDTASSITGVDATNSDVLFKVETSSITIGGPSAGGAMAVAVAALLQGWNVTDDVVMTGMINPDGSVGPIGGVLQKLEAADSVGAKRFLVPLGQSTVVVTYQEQDPRTGAVTQREEIVDLKEVGDDKYDIRVEEVADLYDAIAPFTGYRLVRPEPTTDPLQGQRYGGITTRLAQNLTSQMAQRLSDVSGRYETVRSEMATEERQTMDDQLALAQTRVVSARAAQNES